ncbi:MAG: methionine gamma-lyase [Herpetosiphon sp.]
MTQDKQWTLNTRLVHEGERSGPFNATPTSMPIYLTSTYLHSSAEALDNAFAEGGMTYSRYGNPTVNAFESAVTLAEGGVGAVAFSSGMAAIHAAIIAAGTARGSTEPTFRRVLAARDLYGTTRSMLSNFFAAQGVTTDLVDTTDLAAVAHAMTANPPDVVMVETISNPLLKVVDLEAIAALCATARARLVVDNTLPTPLLVRPLELGADLVVHSATKYLGGHGDVLGGVVVARKNLVLDNLRAYSKMLGAVLGPFEARLLSRGIKTLSLRFQQQCRNAERVATWLSEQPSVRVVHYPSLPSYPQHALAQRLLGGSGGAMVTFELQQANQPAAFRFMNALQLFLRATTLGDIYSLVSYPPMSSHREWTVEQRLAAGITDGTLRLSIGIEDAADLITDLDQALRHV